MRIKRASPLFVVVLAALMAAAIGAWAQDSDATASADHTAPSYDMKAQALMDLESVQKKFVDLANAVPAEKLTWRPSSDSRSFAEVFLHVSGERYRILCPVGAAPPAGLRREDLRKINDRQNPARRRVEQIVGIHARKRSTA